DQAQGAAALPQSIGGCRLPARRPGTECIPLQCTDRPQLSLRRGLLCAALTELPRAVRRLRQSARVTPRTTMASSREREQEIYRGNSRLATRASTRAAVLRLFTDWGFVVRAARFALGLPVPMQTEDRRVLEQIIFPYFGSASEMRTVLFVGCDWYTKHYQRVFFRSHTFWTIDPAPRAARFGGRQHIIAPLESLEEHFPGAHFDRILWRGVAGFASRAQAECSGAFEDRHPRVRAEVSVVVG